MIKLMRLVIIGLVTSGQLSLKPNKIILLVVGVKFAFKHFKKGRFLDFHGNVLALT
jgi:hypothetical protein